MRTVEVIVSASEFDKLKVSRGEVMANTDIMARLRKQGVPILGAISIQGVENGELTMFRNNDRALVYRWKGHPVGRLAQANTPAATSEEDDEL